MTTWEMSIYIFAAVIFMALFIMWLVEQFAEKPDESGVYYTGNFDPNCEFCNGTGTIKESVHMSKLECNCDEVVK